VQRPTGYALWLIASETALAVMLMVGAGLLLAHVLGLLQENPVSIHPELSLPISTCRCQQPDLDRYSSNPEILNSFVRRLCAA